MDIDITKMCHPYELVGQVVQEAIERCGKPPEFSVRFIPELDETTWGLKKKTLVTIGARPSQGKSNLLLQLAYEFSTQGKSVVFFSLEMTMTECIQRLLANYCDIDNFDLTSGKIKENYNEKYAAVISKFTDTLKTRKLIFIESMGKTFEELFTIMEKLKNIDCVVIDYIQNIRSGKYQDNKTAIDEYILKLREYAIKKNFLAIIGSQINRGTYDNTKITPPEMHELKGTGNLEECSDLVWLLHWNYWYSHETDEKNRFWVRVAKNRGGRTAIFDCKISPEHNRIWGEKNDRTKQVNGSAPGVGENPFGDKRPTSDDRGRKDIDG